MYLYKIELSNIEIEKRILMELRVLRYFLAVAREENITAAAQSLHVTQPTLSRQIIELENELGKKLFIRGSRKVVLTEEGMLFRKRAQQIIELMDKTVAEMTGNGPKLSGDIYIGGGESDAMRLIAKTFHSLHEMHPGIRFHIYSGNAYDVTEWLDRGLLEFALLIDYADIENYNYIRLPAADSWGVLMRKDCDLAQKPFVTPADLKGLPLFVSRQTVNHNLFTGWLGQDFNSLDILATYNLIYNASLMVEEGLGYAMCLDKLINTAGDSHLCFRPLNPQIEAPVYLAWKKNQVFTKAAKAFLQQLQKQIQD